MADRAATGDCGGFLAGGDPRQAAGALGRVLHVKRIPFGGADGPFLRFAFSQESEVYDQVGGGSHGQSVRISGSLYPTAWRGLPRSIGTPKDAGGELRFNEWDELAADPGWALGLGEAQERADDRRPADGAADLVRGLPAERLEGEGALFGEGERADG